MKRNNKIEAFTLTEITVALLISAIVVGIAFSVLNLVQKQMMTIQKNYKNNTQINMLETALWIDFKHYANAEYNTIEDELKLFSELDSVKYKFKKEQVIKASDTFFIPLQNKAFFFNNNTVNNGKVDALRIEFSKEFQNQKLFIFKKNDAALFMN